VAHLNHPFLPQGNMFFGDINEKTNIADVYIAIETDKKGNK
jgi:hypothetical protein